MTRVTVTCHKQTKQCGLSNPRTESEQITHKHRDEETGKTVNVPTVFGMQDYLLLARDGDHSDHGHSHRVIPDEPVLSD